MWGSGREDLSHHRYVFDRFLARTDPDVAAAKIIRASDRGRRRVLIGVDAHLADYLARATGTGYERLISIPRASPAQGRLKPRVFHR